MAAEEGDELVERGRVVVDGHGGGEEPGVSGEASWDRGRRDGHVEVAGPDDAWHRMLLAAAYPGRPADLLTRLRKGPAT